MEVDASRATVARRFAWLAPCANSSSAFACRPRAVVQRGSCPTRPRGLGVPASHARRGSPGAMLAIRALLMSRVPGNIGSVNTGETPKGETQAFDWADVGEGPTGPNDQAEP